MKHAVLTDTNGYYTIVSNEETLTEYEPSIAHLHMIMQGHKIDVLWAMPGCHFSNTVRREHFETMEGKHYHAYVPEHLVHNRVYGALVRYKLALDHGISDSDRYFMFPGNREWKVPQGKDKGVWDVKTSQELLQTVELLEARYHVPILWNPGRVGWECFTSLTRRGDQAVYPLNETQREEFESMEKQIIQPSGYAALTQDGEYIHGFDKNAQFLGAAQGVELGSGPYSYEEEFQPKSCGLWRYQLGTIDRHFPGMPGEGIASTDLLVALQLARYQPTVTGGIVWGQHKRYLNQWAIDMWNSRAYFIGMAEWGTAWDDRTRIYGNCASTAKMIPNSMIGVLVRKGFPHWNRLIVHRAMANQLHTVLKVERDIGARPVLVSRDSLYYVSDNPDPYKAFPGLLEYEHEQRGYKLIGTCKLDKDIRHAFTRAHDKRFGVGGIEGVIKRSMLA